MSHDRQPAPEARGGFITTQWSLVLAAGDGRNSQSRQALAKLCQLYWLPVYSYFRRRGHSPESSQDLTQGFFARLLEKSGISQARRDRGRFRSFLLAAASHYLTHQRDYEAAAKRGGGQALLSLDLDNAEAHYLRELSHDETPDRVFEKRWTLTLLERVLERLDAEMDREGQHERFRRLRPLLTGAEDIPYQRLARDLEISESAVKVAIHRLRKRFGALLREEVGQTLDDPARIDQEIRDLFSALE